MTITNRRIVLAARPGTGWPDEPRFRLEEGPVPEPGDGQAVLRHLAVSVDPYQRARPSPVCCAVRISASRSSGSGPERASRADRRRDT
jgi:hypothetical protein